MTSEERLRELEEKYENYTVYDNQGDKIGKVDDLFVDENDREEYFGVKLGLLGSKSTLIPLELARINESDRTIEISDSKDHVKDAPSFDDDEDITGEYERRIRDHFGLESAESSSSGGGYGGYSGAAAGTQTGDRGYDDSQDYSNEGGYSSETSSGSQGHADERTGSTVGDGGSQSAPEYRGPEGSSGSQESLGGSGTPEGTSEGVPTSRQTEETETYQEGGRTKVRRRIVREEVIDADEDPNARP